MALFLLGGLLAVARARSSRPSAAELLKPSGTAPTSPLNLETLDALPSGDEERASPVRRWEALG